MNTSVDTNSSLSFRDEQINITFSDSHQLSFTINDLNGWYTDALYCVIQYGSQLGACLILLLLLFLLTKPDKRLNPLFLLNSTALVFNFFRLLLVCIYFTGPFNEAYNYFSESLEDIPSSAYGVSITGAIFTALLHIIIAASLLLQVQVVCITLRRIYRLIILISSAALAGAAVAFRFYLTAVNIKTILDPNDFDETTLVAKVDLNTDIITTTSIFWFSAIFCIKLGYALLQRKKLGLRRWGSMQILFTMGCQTMIIPAIFSICQHFIDFPALSSFVLTLVTIFLPLSALWASASINGISRPDLVAMDDSARYRGLQGKKSEGSEGTGYSGDTYADGSGLRSGNGKAYEMV